MAKIYRAHMLAALGAVLLQDATVSDPSTGSSTAAAPAETPVPAGMKAEMFHFRKEKVKDEAGNEVGEAFRHPSVKIPLPVPTREELVAIFSDDARTSEQKFVLDLVYDSFYAQARSQINEWREQNEKGTVTANIIDYSKLTINALANMPASERGNKIDDEDMKSFLADYTSVMPQASGKDASKIKAQAGILEKQLRTVRTDKKVLNVMNDLLTLYAANTPNLEENQSVYDFLTGRINKWLKAEPKNVLESIM